MKGVRVRYAPSPTGTPHIGNVRTALFNFLLAKNKNGKFILRIEDTDQKRIVPGAIEKIQESLKVLGLDWDEYGEQSKRLPLYNRHLEILKKKRLVSEDSGAWRFKVSSQSQSEKIKWNDLVHGPIEFSSEVIEDFVIMKSDGFPTYHFASVVDDHQMQISHVLRGDEWISSTPKHLLLYEAFGWTAPLFVHLPPILGNRRQKLSKREGARSVLEYIANGYLPEAIVNFLALLGWAPKGDRELFSMDELTREFSLERLNKNSPIFNKDKLNWFNKKYLQKYATGDLVQKIKEYSGSSTSEVFKDEQRLTKIIDLVRDRMVTLADFDKVASIFFEKGDKAPPAREKIEEARMAILAVKNWQTDDIAKTLDLWIAKHDLDPADFKNTLRLAVFSDNTPPIYQSLAVLTREEVIGRIDDALQKP